METVVIDLAGHAAPLVWLASPVGLVSLVAIVGFVLSGIPGRIILGMEAKLARRKGLCRRGLDRHDNDELLTAVSYMEREE
ncbi:MAG: hypothetical protein U9N84_04145 [Actinomycetota bacterium]|nr:hypothetical protein [Actinomycetota bacterium]